MFKKKSINPTFSSSMLNQEQPDCNTFVKELAQGLLFPLHIEDGIGAGNCSPKYRPCLQKDVSFVTSLHKEGLCSEKLS